MQGKTTSERSGRGDARNWFFLDSKGRDWQGERMVGSEERQTVARKRVCPGGRRGKGMIWRAREREGRLRNTEGSTCGKTGRE